MPWTVCLDVTKGALCCGTMIDIYGNTWQVVLMSFSIIDIFSPFIRC